MSSTAQPTDRPVGATREDRSEVAQPPHLVHYLRILSRRRWVIFGTLISVVAITAYATARQIPQYEAKAQVMIEVERPRVIVFQDDQKNDGGDEPRDYQETQRRIIASRSLASRTLDKVGLWQHPEFGGVSPDQSSAVGRRVDSVIGWVADLPTKLSKSPNYDHGVYMKAEGPNPDDAVGFKEREEQTTAIDRFLSRLEVREVGGSRLVDVAFRSADPKLAAAVANALTDAYVAQNREFKETLAKEASDWLEGQLEEHRKQLHTSEEALQRFREERPDASGGEGADLVVRRLEGLNAALTTARTDRIQKETLYNQVQSLEGDRTSLENLPLVQNSPSVQGIKRELAQMEQQDLQLRQKLGERHPERAKLLLAIQTTREQLKAEVNAVAERIKSDYTAAQEQESTLTNAVESLKREAMSASGKRAEYENLARAATADQQIFGTLLQRAKETGVTSGLVASNIRVVDPASVPTSPVSPNPRRNLLLAFVGGALLAVGMALFADYMDKAIASPDQVKAELGLTCLGLVPTLSGWKKSDGAPLISNGVPSSFQEAFRTVRTNVLFSSRDEPVRTILVTSTGPGEGKTVIASNLALSLAQTGQRVLLVDADMRRPRVHHVFSERQEPGLSELTTGRALASQSILRTAVSGLWLLPAGAIPPNPSEILSSDRFRRFVTELSQLFDWVVIDSPPVMAVTDAALLAHVAAGVLFVVAAEDAKGPLAKHALEHLDSADARFLGAVLNKVNFKRNAFYYADYYRREYGDYYTTVVDGSRVAVN